MKKKALSTQGHWCCSRHHKGRIEMAVSGLILIQRQRHREGRAEGETNASRKGPIRASTALSPASLHFLRFNLG